MINKKNQYQALNEVFKEQAYAQALLTAQVAGEC